MKIIIETITDWEKDDAEIEGDRNHGGLSESDILLALAGETKDKKESKWTIAVWMYQMSQEMAGQPWCVMAGFVMVSIPTALVFLLCQKVILRGMVLPSMK